MTAIPNRPFSELRKKFSENPRSLLFCCPGIVPVNKPEGITSHDAVAKARKQLNMRKVGHGGTLDPMAEGVLLILLGQGTRLFDSLQTFRKSYRATLRLGERTDTQDTSGAPIDGADPACLPVSEEAIKSALAGFRGQIEQVPPMYSALKKNGKKLYELARAGKSIDREPRPVEVYDLQLLYTDGREAEIEMSVSKGFYVRTLIDDLGQVLGSGAVMSALTRTAVGPFGLDDCVAVDAIKLSGEGRDEQV